jgi:chromosome segregation ATPase
LIEKLIIKIASSDPLFNSVFKQLGHNEKQDLLELQSKKSSLNANLSARKKEVGNLMQFITQGTAQDIGSVKEKLNELENQQKMIEEEIDKVKDQIELIKRTNITKLELKDIFNEISKFYYKALPEEQKYMIRTIIKDIKIELKKKATEGKIEINFG